MNLCLKIAQFYIPGFIKKKKLKELFDCTADAFQCKIPQIKNCSYDKLLKEYALFTKDNVEKSIEQGKDLHQIKMRLYENAYQLGEKLRKDFRITTPEQVLTILKTLYNIIGIQFQYNVQGEITIKKCFFSNFYSDRVCQVISSLDEGVAAGLSNGTRFSFYQRITQGKDCCKAHFNLKKNLT